VGYNAVADSMGPIFICLAAVASQICETNTFHRRKCFPRRASYRRGHLAVYLLVCKL